MVDMNSALFTSKSDEWSTPQDFYDRLNIQFGFTLDPCATKDNHKCDKYFTIEDDGLKQSWEGGTVFVNPPYSNIAAWLEKAWKETRNSKKQTCVVCLIPSRTDTKYWHQYVMESDIIYFVKGRLKFGGCKNSAPFPSSVVVFLSQPVENYLFVGSILSKE
jgi:site-specific DNA-methyltransferase (adenine-specific)